MFFDIYKHVYSESVFNTQCIEIKQNKRYKNAVVFLSQAPTQQSFTFNLRFLFELEHKIPRPCKTVCGIFHFRLGFFFINVHIFFQQNACTL